MFTKRTKRLLIASVIIVIIILLIASAFGEFMLGGYFKKDPDIEYVPVAESLIQNPQPLLNFITNVNPPPGSTITGNELICVAIRVPSSDTTSFVSWSSILLNGQKISRRDMGVAAYGDLADTSHTTLRFCFMPMLHSGYHVFELYLSSTIGEFFNPDVDNIYSWAYLVE